ncbi:MAG: hypothetical protein IT221_06480 [Fluviicola sp.]|nr:hypothetical protein [Fluviicola sp.]
MLPLLLMVFTVFSQRGKNGSYTVTAANTQLNAYTSLTANAAVGANSITVASNTLTNAVLTSALAAGDLIMIIQMQGATMDIDATPATPVALGGWGGTYTVPIGHQGDWGSYQDLWGQVTNYNNAGKHEVVEVRSVAGGTTINLMCSLTNSYTASGHVQIVRIPRLINLTVNAACSVVPALWDGTIGGVLALEVNGILSLSGSITATGYGFRGGVCDLQTAGSPPPSATGVGYCASSAAIEGAEKGEGIGGFYAEYDALYSRYCKSAPANGGGGGGNHNAGGGGGANVGTGAYTGKGNPVAGYAAIWNLESPGFATSTSSGGGRGGYSYSTGNQNAATVGPNNTLWSGDYRRKEGGLGGHPLTYNASCVFMGGGGGAGDANSNPTQGGAGGRGGGIVYLTVYGSITGTGAIQANGAAGQNANPLGQVAIPLSNAKYGNDGAGGAGGGGAIVISNGTAIPATITLSATGGVGGNQVVSFGNFASPAMEADGPGGGGGGGMIKVTFTSGAQSVLGGAGGTTNSAHVNLFPPNGATAGAAGISGIVQPFFDLTTANVTICSGTSTTLTATVVGTLPGTITWYSTQFGSTVLGTGTSFTTPTLTATTTYYVGTCPSTFRKAVVVTVSPLPTINTTSMIINNVTCVGNDGSITGITASGTSLTYSWSNGPITLNNTGLSNATYTLTVTDNLGCIATLAVPVGTNCVLPIELSHFYTFCNDEQQSVIRWEVNNEVDVENYELSVSTNGVDFNPLYLIPSYSNTVYPLAYEQIDDNRYAGFSLLYYQLKTIRENGESESVAIVSQENCINDRQADCLLSFPTNISSNSFEIVGSNWKAPYLDFDIIDMNGRVVQSFNYKIDSENFNLKVFLDATLMKGMYFLKSSTEVPFCSSKIIIE